MATTASAAGEPAAKRARSDATVSIGTHSGTFHCDEAMACYLLHQTEEFAGAPIVRTRDPALLEQQTVIVDVGGKYDPATHRYDHHQRGFDDTLDDKHTTKLSSAGLVYKHFGRGIIAKQLGLTSADDIEQVYQRVYTNLIESLDAIDNGISQYPSDLVPLFKINTDLGSRVARLNPDWNEPATDADRDANFLKAVKITGEEFASHVHSVGRVWLPARSLVVDALAKRTDVHPSGQIVLFEQACPWKSHLFDLEAEQGIETPVLYALFADQSGQWRIQAVAVREGSFESRKALPEAWRGLRDDALSEHLALPGCVFVHMSGFIGGHKTREGALKMAEMALTS